jgi:acyl carrier protein
MTTEQSKQAISLIAQVAHKNPKDFSVYIPLSAYRMDSLDMISAITAIEEAFNIKVPDSVLPGFNCGSDILDYLEEVV